MSWKPLKLEDSEYRKRLEGIRDKMKEFRDAMLEAELKKIEHLASVMQKVNEHREKQNVLDT